MISKILVPLDGSEFAERALPYVEELAGKLEASVILVWVLHPMVIMSDYGAATYQQITAAEQEEAKTYLRARQNELQREGLAVQFRIIEGATADSIIDLAFSEEVDLIVMSTHGRSGLSRWVYGSVATKVLQKAPCPIFLVRVQ